MSPTLAKTFVTFLSVLGLFLAQGAAALVTVNQTTTAVGPLAIGDTFTVDVLLSWDGSADGTGNPPGLIGIFTSHEWSNTQLLLTSAAFNTMFESRPIPLKGTSTYDPQLGRLGTISGGVFGDDLTSTARTIQYAQAQLDPLVPSSAKTDELITVLTFEVIGIGDGVAEIAGVFLIGDDITGDSSVFGPAATVNLPEPGSVLLVVSSLASIFGVAAVRRRRALI